MSTPPDGSAGPPAPPSPGWGGYAGGPYAPPERRRRPGRALFGGLATVLLITVSGAPLGLLWRVVAPGVPVTQSADGPILRDPQPEQFIAADGWFTVLGLIFGVLVAVAAWRLLRRWRGLVGLVAVGFGTVGAALVAWWLGRQIGLGDYEQWRATAVIGQAYLRPPDLRAGSVHLLWGVLPSVRGDLLVPAFGAVVTYTLLAGWAEDPELDADRGYPPAPVSPPGSGYPTGPGHAPPGYPPAPEYPLGSGRPPGLAYPAPPGEPAAPDPWSRPTGQVSWGAPDRPAPTAAPAPRGPGAADPPRD